MRVSPHGNAHHPVSRTLFAWPIFLLGLSLLASMAGGCMLRPGLTPTPTKTRSVPLIARQRATLVEATRVTWTPSATVVPDRRRTPSPLPPSATLPPARVTPLPPASAPVPTSDIALQVTMPPQGPSTPAPVSASSPVPMSTPVPANTPVPASGLTPSATATLQGANATPTPQASTQPTPTSTATPSPTPQPTVAGSNKPDIAQFYVYIDEESPENHFWSTGWDGDTGDVTLYQHYTDNPCLGTTGIQVFYAPSLQTTDGWAEVDWQEPAGNSGSIVGAGFDLSNYNRLVFCARGEAGGEQVEFGMGGSGRDPINCLPQAPYPDSSCRIGQWFTLTDQWQEYTISLGSTDLRRVIRGFFWKATQARQREGVSFYLDDIRYEHR
jgi:hypothetical protein